MFILIQGAYWPFELEQREESGREQRLVRWMMNDISCLKFYPSVEALELNAQNIERRLRGKTLSIGSHAAFVQSAAWRKEIGWWERWDVDDGAEVMRQDLFYLCTPCLP